MSAVIGLGLTACGSSSPAKVTSPTTAPTGAGATTATTAATGAQSTNAIKIQSFKFTPSPASAKVGDTITVTNADGTDHSLTADDGSFDSGVFSGGTKTFTVSKAGSIKYHCRIHNFMTGVIQVSG